MERFALLHAAHEELKSQYKKDTSNVESRALYYKNRHDLLVQQLYGKKSEKRQLATLGSQLSLPGFKVENRPEPPAVYEKVEYTRQKKAAEGTRGSRSSRFPEWLRREVEEVKPESTTCPYCNEEMKRADTPEITEKLCCSRDPFYVKEYHRHLYTCQGCQTAATKPALPEVFPRSLFDHTTIAFAMTNKFRYGVPLVRQAKTVAKKLPSYKHGCLWGLYGDQNEVYYEFSSSRTHENCHNVLESYSGYLVVDAYDGFEQLPGIGSKVTLVHCNNHARRKFVEAENSDRTLAHEALSFYQALYKTEEECKDHLPQERKLYRLQYAVPILNKFKEWLGKVSLGVEAKTPLAKGVSYVLRRWETLTRYLEDGRIPFDTMQIERSFRAIAVGRKNFLHCSSELGAKNAAIEFSLIGSCELQGIDPFIYLCDVLDRISSHSSAADLIPRAWKTQFLDEATTRYGLGIQEQDQ